MVRHMTAMAGVVLMEGTTKADADRWKGKL
jgi:hypothetical protein